MQNKVILSIESNIDRQDALAQYLRDDGYNFIPASDIDIALQKTEDIHVDLILLGLGPVEGDGMQACGQSAIVQIRGKSNAGLIITSSRGDLAEKIICLEAGADDYVCGPLEMRELSAMIRALLRRCANAQDDQGFSPETAGRTIKFEGWSLRPDRHQLRDPDHRTVELTPGEYKLLRAFVASAGRIISRAELSELVQMHSNAQHARSVDILVARLRRKLGADAALIRTVRGTGYIFDGLAGDSADPD